MGTPVIDPRRVYLNTASMRVCTTDATITRADQDKYIELSSGGTDSLITFDTPANLGLGWRCTIKNTDDALNGAFWYITNACHGISPATVDGISHSFAIMPHAKLLFYVANKGSGLTLYCDVITPFAFKYRGLTFDFRMPPGYAMFANGSILRGAGGSGSKLGLAAGAASPGGGGASTPLAGILCPSAGTTISVVCPSGAAGVTSAGSGSVGGNATFSWSGGPSMLAGGGGGGYAAVSGNLPSGSGGGSLSAGATPASATSIKGGEPTTSLSSGTLINAGFGLGGCGSYTSAATPTAAWGGCASPVVSVSSVSTGGNSVFGGSSGGAANTTNSASGGTCSATGATGGAGSVSGSGGDGGEACGGGATLTGTRSGKGGDASITLTAI